MIKRIPLITMSALAGSPSSPASTLCSARKTYPLHNLALASAAATFERTRNLAVSHARTGNRDFARWWGEQARADWRRLEDCLSA